MLRRYFMSIITDAVVEAIVKFKGDANTLSPKEIEQLDGIITEKVADATAALAAKVESNTQDLQKIADALVDPALDATATAVAIGEIVGTEPNLTGDVG